MDEKEKDDENQFNGIIKCIHPQLSKDEYESELFCFEKLQRNNLPYIFSIDHLARICEISSEQLHLFLSDKRKAYSSFKIPKKRGGFRNIDAPSKRMKNIQRWILENILYKLNPGDYAHGFLPSKSIVTNASVHINQDLVLGIDLKDFFPSIKLSRVRGLFKGIGYNDEVSLALAELCTFRYRLPQGAPTSPMISNLISWRMDLRLARFCEKKNLKYSRYADDITISGGKHLPRYKTLIFRIIKEEGFEINEEKIRMHDRGSSQRVTGIVVNDKVSLGRNKKKALRAIVHNIVKNGPIEANRENDPFFKERLFGYIGHAKMVDSDFAASLINLLKEVDWKLYNQKSKELKESELNKRSLRKDPYFNGIPFQDLGFFKQIEEIPQKEWNEEFIKQLDNLREECSEHRKQNCKDCLHIRKKIYENCMKYLLGHYIGNTGGHHHGHEVYDIAGETDLYGGDVFVAFLAKSNAEKKSKESLLMQTLHCTNEESIDVISIVTTSDLDHQLLLDLRKVIRRCGDGQLYCLIMREEMGKILYSYKTQLSKDL